MSKITAKAGWLTLICFGFLIWVNMVSTAVAHNGGWTVTRMSGEVRFVKEGIHLASVSKGARLSPGTGIRTGAGGRIMLVHGSESMMVAPNSAITIPDTFKASGHTTLLQRRGSVQYEVDREQGRPFHVLTPHLAAIVKGTQFTVTLEPGESRVDVEKGAVEVVEYETGRSGLVAGGQSAILRNGPGESLQVSGGGFIAPIRAGLPLVSPSIPEVESREAEAAEASGEEGAGDVRRNDRAASSGSPADPSLAGPGGAGDRSRSTSASGPASWSLPGLVLKAEVAIPALIGFAVALGVATRNRRRKDRRKAEEK